MIRRWTALVLAILLPWAAGAETLRLWDVDVDAAFRRAHPDWAYEAVRYPPFSDRLSGLAQTQADVVMLRSYNEDLRLFARAGVMADLSDCPQITEAVARMRPWAQAMVTGEDGAVLALPVSALVRPVYWYRDAWDAAGLPASDVPQSFAELLDFLDAWAASPVPGVCASRLVRWNTGDARCNYAAWLLDILLHAHQAQQYHAGEQLVFSTEEFIELAERARSTGLALYRAEPRQGARRSMLQLFQSDLNGGEHANNGRDYGMSHAIPLRLTTDQPALTAVAVQTVFLRAGSDHMAQGAAVLAHLAENPLWQWTYALYADFAPGDYPTDGGRTVHIDAGWLADLAAWDGTFVACPNVFGRTREGVSQRDRLTLRFCRGELTASEYARGLDGLVP